MTTPNTGCEKFKPRSVHRLDSGSGFIAAIWWQPNKQPGVDDGY
jgi:hypothetical protein